MTTPHSTNITYVVSPPNTEIPLITINISAQSPLKLTSTNYLSWKLQFETLFIGYDLIGYIDGSKPCPPTTITTNNTATTNLSHKLWIRQDQLLLNALIGSLFPIIIPFIAQAKTAKEAWTILANTYDKPSYGRIKQVKTKLKNPTKGSQNVIEYLHSVKVCADELAILGAPLDLEDLTDKILDGLSDDYKELVLRYKLVTLLSHLMSSTRSYSPLKSLHLQSQVQKLHFQLLPIQQTKQTTNGA